MKLSINLFSTIAFLLLINSQTAIAQRGGLDGNPEQIATQQTKLMAEKLNLNKKQIAKAKKINLATVKKAQELRQEAKGNRSAMQSRGKVIMEENNTAMKLILTANQYIKYEKMQAEFLKKRQERRRSR